jgi:hypothetical protein
MSRRFQFSLRWVFVLTCAAAATAVLLRLFVTDITKKEGGNSDFHFLAIGGVLTFSSMYLWGPKGVYWSVITVLFLFGIVAAFLKLGS